MQKRCMIALLVFVALFSVVQVQATHNASDVTYASGSNGSSNRSSQATIIAANHLAQGGNTTQVNLSMNVITDKWQGYFGETNGSVILGAGNRVLYDFGGFKSNFVLAVIDPSFNFASICNATNEQNAQNLTAVMDLVFFNTTGDDPRTHADSANRSFNSKSKIGGILGVDSVALNPAASGFFSGIFQNGSVNATTQDLASAVAQKHFAFGVNVTNDATDFLGAGHTSDYELMVPVPTVGSTYGVLTYFFYMDIE